MTDRENKELPDQRHRSFVVSDFSMRDIPFMLLAFSMISVASVVLGLFVESLSSFWRGYLWGIVTTILSVARPNGGFGRPHQPSYGVLMWLEPIKRK